MHEFHELEHQKNCIKWTSIIRSSERQGNPNALATPRPVHQQIIQFWIKIVQIKETSHAHWKKSYKLPHWWSKSPRSRRMPRIPNTHTYRVHLYYILYLRMKSEPRETVQRSNEVFLSPRQVGTVPRMENERETERGKKAEWMRVRWK